MQKCHTDDKKSEDIWFWQHSKERKFGACEVFIKIVQQHHTDSLLQIRRMRQLLNFHQECQSVDASPSSQVKTYGCG